MILIVLKIILVLAFLGAAVMYMIDKRKKIIFKEKEIRRANLRRARAERNKAILLNKKKP